MTKEKCLCVHGHFYQPPRENPWIEEIEVQESAFPFHDWNERIHYECYFPNTIARVLDDKGFILDMVNNYEMMSFNFGPTLLSWLFHYHPETYERILEADRLSAVRHSGHGNAIAQAYNHMIMPLANERDKRTQILWGIEDFRFRFKRDPEALWLPETACNETTLKALIEAGLKYLILAPHQAESVRSLSSDRWHDVSIGSIDPKIPYRCYLRNDPEKFIDIFFYDGPISKEVGFGDLAFEAKYFMGSVERACVDNMDHQLIHISTDGETYGHHKAFGERALAYLFHVLAPKRGFRAVNYGEYLDMHPTTHAVRLKEGENGEGTAWSCAHGVRRWKEHCGCRGGGPGEWTQYWRKPLRESLDWLRDELVKVFEQSGSQYLKNVWDARNDYVHVVLDRSEKSVGDFFDRNSCRPLSREERILCMKLLEMQRHAMLMYTSCGWFFTEISGIETVQILQYAARAIQLAHEAGGQDLEKEFLAHLAQAKSNIPEFGDGRGVYEKLVRPRAVSMMDVVAHYGIGSIFDDFYGHKEIIRLYSYWLYLRHQRRESFGNITLNFGRIRASSEILLEERDLLFIGIQFGTFDFRCSVKPFESEQDMERIEKELFDGLAHLDVVAVLRRIDELFGEKYYGLKDLLLPERTRIISLLTKESLEKINYAHEQLFEENRRMFEIYSAINLSVPNEIRFAVAHTVKRRLLRALRELEKERFNPKKTAPVFRIVDMAHAFHLDFGNEDIIEFLSAVLLERVKTFRRELRDELLRECLNVQKIAAKIGLELNLRLVQDELFNMLSEWRTAPEKLPALTAESFGHLVKLAKFLKVRLPVFDRPHMLPPLESMDVDSEPDLEK